MLVPALAGLSILVLAGCGAGPGTAVSGPSASVSASHSGDPGAGTPTASPTDIPVAAAGGPSAAALMVCSMEIQEKIVQILALASAPGNGATWADKLFTCTYALPAGSFVLSVKEAADPDAAHAYFQDVQRSTAGAAPIEGLANLGFPAFQTPTSAVFVKDNFVLTVDAVALPEPLGPHQVTRAAFAYQVATTVLACWSE
ncbi:hypothetical protein GCM10007170_46110 [Arthrobacter liuii]|uniref:DUF3558 domain-containing protein n=2 Tax=Arthrobacter liuii TaxID=1476996 RepID=A0ABQ2B258_9MICC|nr:hypothetical protein GCM10007170_46110 [Arthrobacter liuii]